MPISGPGSRSRTPAASGSSWPGFPPPALCVVTGDQFRRQDDGPRAACACGRRCQRHGQSGRPCWRHERVSPPRAMMIVMVSRSALVGSHLGCPPPGTCPLPFYAAKAQRMAVRGRGVPCAGAAMRWPWPARAPGRGCRRWPAGRVRSGGLLVGPGHGGAERAERGGGDDLDVAAGRDLGVGHQVVPDVERGQLR